MAVKFSQNSFDHGAQLLKRIQSYAFKDNGIDSKVSLDEESQQILSQLRGNVLKLEDMNGRLEFMMGELQGLIKTRIH